MPRPAPDLELPPTDAVAEKEPSKPASNLSPAAPPSKNRDGAHDGGRASEAAVSRALEQLQFETLGVIAQAPATEGVLRHGEVPTSALDAAAARAVGVGPGDLGAQVLRGTPLGVGRGAGLELLGTPGLERSGDAGRAKAVSGPPGRINIGKQVNAGAHITNADAVVAAMRAGFKRCYERALAQNADAEGRIALSIRVGPGGEVQSVSADTSGNLPPSVGACVSARARAAQFEPPEGGLAVVQVPVTFVKQ
jgi:TonB family protein